jgi:hypothetical protein
LSFYGRLKWFTCCDFTCFSLVFSFVHNVKCYICRFYL